MTDPLEARLFSSRSRFLESDFSCNNIRLSEELLRADGGEDRDDSRFCTFVRGSVDGSAGSPTESRPNQLKPAAPSKRRRGRFPEEAAFATRPGGMRERS